MSDIVRSLGELREPCVLQKSRDGVNWEQVGNDHPDYPSALRAMMTEIERNNTISYRVRRKENG